MDEKNDVVSDVIDFADNVMNNRAVRRLNKINSIKKNMEEYEETYEETKSHIKSAVIVGTGVVVENAVDVSPLIVGGSIAASGGFSPLSCITGSVVGVGMFVVGSNIVDELKDVSKQSVSVAYDFIKNMKNELPDYVQKIIYKCISKPVENSLKHIHGITTTSIKYIKTIVSKVIYDNWNKIEPSGTVIYCNDINNKQITINFDESTIYKIYNYCNKHERYYYQENPGSSYKPTSSFENIHRQFNDEFVSSRTYNFDNVRVSDNQTPYDKIKIIRPNTGLLTRTHIDVNSIPNYNVSTVITNKRSGFGGSICAGLCIMVQVAIII